MARQLIECLGAEFEPERFHDTYRDQVLELIDRKAAGDEIVTRRRSRQPAKVVDLMAALEASVAAAKAGPQAPPERRRAPTRPRRATRPRPAGQEGGGQALAAKKATSRAPAKKAAKRTGQEGRRRKSDA